MSIKQFFTLCISVGIYLIIPSFITAATVTFLTPDAITGPSGGLKITNAGLYVFTDDVDYGQINTTPITISTDDVVIDLAGKTLTSVVGTGQNIAINIVGPRNNITIKNGTLDNFNRYTILVDAGVRNITVENLIISNAPTSFSGTAPTGIFFNGNAAKKITEVVIKNCRIIKGRYGILANSADNIDLIDSTFARNFSRGIEANNCNLWDITNCQVSNQIGSDGAGSGGVVANGCSFWNILKSDFSLNSGLVTPVNVVGVSFVGLGATSGDHIIDGCTFCNNRAGLGLSRGLALIDTHSSVIRNCIANGNFSTDSFAAGFYVVSGSSGNLFENCVADGNYTLGAFAGAAGFNIEGIGNHLINCTAKGNLALGGGAGQGFIVTSLASACLVQNCMATGNGDDGFINDSTTSSLIGNFASGNPVANYAGIGTFGFVTVLNGAQPVGGSFDERRIDNIEIV